MKIKIIAVGRLKEKYLKDAVTEYSKRLQRYANLEIIEVGDESIPHKFSHAAALNILKTEAHRIKYHMPDSKYVIALDIRGKELNSEDLALGIEQLLLRGNSEITFLIGGSLGLHPSLTDLSHENWSFSKLTFPHQLMRVILLEQLYRGFTIIRGGTYHK